jgi:hypothetical protein
MLNITQNKKDIKKVFFNFIKSIFCLLTFMSCFFCDKFKFQFNFGEIKAYNIILGILLLFINYYFVFPNIYKNKNTKIIELFFFIESITLILVSLGFFLSPFIKNKILQNILQIGNMISYILIIHSIIELYIEYLNKNKHFLPLKFFSYLALFGFSFYLLGKEFDITNLILKILSFVFLSLFFFYIFICSKFLYFHFSEKK